jgi:uncharacterized protein
MDELKAKYNSLKEYLLSLNKVAVAFSGGVDSTFILMAAVEALGKNNVIAYTATGSNFTKRDTEDAFKYAKLFNVKHLTLDTDAISVVNSSGNSALRCYYCKRSIFSELIKTAKTAGFENIIEASHADDLTDYRPGARAVKELGVLSPLKEFSFTKTEIRTLLKMKEIDVHNKPSIACLISRFPYNNTISEGDVFKVGASEEYLYTLGFDNCRVRHYGNTAKIEVDLNMIDKLKSVFDDVSLKLKKLGYDKIEIDEKGYRSGSMNENII